MKNLQLKKKVLKKLRVNLPKWWWMKVTVLFLMQLLWHPILKWTMCFQLRSSISRKFKSCSSFTRVCLWLKNSFIILELIRKNWIVLIWNLLKNCFLKCVWIWLIQSLKILFCVKDNRIKLIKNITESWELLTCWLISLFMLLKGIRHLFKLRIWLKSHLLSEFVSFATGYWNFVQKIMSWINFMLLNGFLIISISHWWQMKIIIWWLR